VALKSQIETMTAQLGTLATERGEVQQRLAQYGARVAQAPEVERELLEVVRELDAARSRFRELRDKKSYASIAEQLERSRKAERFTVVEPPFLPERPARPNRPLILGLGLALSLALAFGAAALREALDPRVHGERGVARLMPWPVLAAMPSAGAQRDASARRAARRRAFALTVGAGVLATAGAALALHFLLMPLDVAWFSALRRLGG
jgi:LPS O-antigen subunit length determinant protein (WzzB/FepE family)